MASKPSLADERVDELSRKAATTSHLRLDDDSTDTMILPDGRTLCFAQYGSSAGPAVFYLHGGGDARKGGAFFDEPAARLGMKVVACDRPGIGGSSPQPNRTVLDHVRDIECLADHLGIQEFGVVGVSGGGPYALACAYAIPAERLRAAAIVCGMAEPSINVAHSGWALWMMLKIQEYCPSLLGWYFQKTITSMLQKPDEELKKVFRQQAQPGFVRRLFSGSEKDAQLFGDDDFLDLAIKGNREYFAQGVNEMMNEWHIWTSDPGFKIEDIRHDLRVHLWYGKQDMGCTVRLGEAIAAELEGRAALHIVDEGHVSLVMNCRDSILKELLDSRAPFFGAGCFILDDITASIRSYREDLKIWT